MSGKLAPLYWLSARDPPPDERSQLESHCAFYFTQTLSKQYCTALALSSSLVATPVLAQAAIIDAIMGGGTVIGTECVNGKVVELVSSDAITDFGPDLTLFVKPEGKTRLRKDAGYTWVDGTGESNKDKVNFVSLATGKSEGVAHYLVGGTAANEVAEFGTSAGGTANVITGQGTHQMQFVSQTDGTITLGTMYTAELVPSDLSYNMQFVPPVCSPPTSPPTWSLRLTPVAACWSNLNRMAPGAIRPITPMRPRTKWAGAAPGVWSTPMVMTIPHHHF